MDLPRVILLISGKRKCGKDYISEKLLKTIGEERCTILRISQPIKSYYAKENNLDLSQLLSENEYKEKYRVAMINWSDEVRSNDPGYFCNITCDKAPSKFIWIVSDIRRHTDINWFKEKYNAKIKTVRISADDDVRASRGWTFTQGVDDVQSECDLDSYKDWDLEIPNNNESEFEICIDKLIKLIEHSI